MFDKPKIFIDLDEYNHLKEVEASVDAIKNSDFVLPYRKAINIFMANLNNPKKIAEELLRNGLELQTPSAYRTIEDALTHYSVVQQ